MRHLARRTVGAQFGAIVPRTTPSFTQPSIISTARPFATASYELPVMNEAQKKAMSKNAQEYVTYETARKEDPRLFCNTSVWGDSAEMRRYRMGGFAMFVGFCFVAIPHLSLSMFRLFRANKISQEDGEYKRQSYAGIQDEVASRHKSKERFRVHKTLPEGKQTQTFARNPGDNNRGSIGKWD